MIGLLLGMYDRLVALFAAADDVKIDAKDVHLYPGDVGRYKGALPAQPQGRGDGRLRMDLAL